MAQSVKHLVRQKHVEKRLFKKNLLNQSQNTRFYVGAPQIKGKFTMDNEWFQLFKRSIFFLEKFPFVLYLVRQLWFSYSH